MQVRKKCMSEYTIVQKFGVSKILIFFLRN